MKKIFVPIIVIILAAGAWWYFAQQGGEQNLVDAKPIKIGWIGPRTGPSAVLGMDGVVAAQIAVDEINEKGGIRGRKVELLVEDDQYLTPKSLSAYGKLVDVDKVDVIFLGTYSSIFSLANKALEDDIIVMDAIDCNRVIAGLNDNIFCLSTDTESVAQVIAEGLNRNNEKKIGIMYYNSDRWMPTAKDYLLKYVEGQVVYETAYERERNDFRTEVSKLMESGANALVLLGYDETGLIMKQARSLGFKGQFYTTGTVTSPSLKDASGGAVDGTIHSLWDAPKDKPQTKQFIEKFTKREKRAPILDFATYPTYDAVKAVILAIEAAGTTETAQLRKALLEVQFDGITGPIMFEKDGSVRIHESLHQYVNGQHIEIE